MTPRAPQKGGMRGTQTCASSLALKDMSLGRVSRKKRSIHVCDGHLKKTRMVTRDVEVYETNTIAPRDSCPGPDAIGELLIA